MKVLISASAEAELEEYYAYNALKNTFVRKYWALLGPPNAVEGSRFLTEERKSLRPFLRLMSHSTINPASACRGAQQFYTKEYA